MPHLHLLTTANDKFQNRRREAPPPETPRKHLNDVVRTNIRLHLASYMFYIYITSLTVLGWKEQQFVTETIAKDPQDLSTSELLTSCAILIPFWSVQTAIIYVLGEVVIQYLSEKATSKKDVTQALNVSLGESVLLKTLAFMHVIESFVLTLYCAWQIESYASGERKNFPIETLLAESYFCLITLAMLKYLRKIYSALDENQDKNINRREKLDLLTHSFQLEWKIEPEGEQNIRFSTTSPRSKLQLPLEFQKRDITKIYTFHLFEILNEILSGALENSAYDKKSLSLRLSETETTLDNIEEIQTTFSEKINQLIGFYAFIEGIYSKLNNLTDHMDLCISDTSYINIQKGSCTPCFRISTINFNLDFNQQLWKSIRILFPTAKLSWSDDKQSYLKIDIPFSSEQHRADTNTLEQNKQLLAVISRERTSTSHSSFEFSPPKNNSTKPVLSKCKLTSPEKPVQKSHDIKPPNNLPDKFLNAETWKNINPLLPKIGEIVEVDDPDTNGNGNIKFKHQRIYIAISHEFLASKDEHAIFHIKNLKTLAHAATSCGRPGVVQKTENTFNIKNKSRLHGKYRFWGDVKINVIENDIKVRLVILNRLEVKTNLPQLLYKGPGSRL